MSDSDLTQTTFGDNQALVSAEQVEMPDVFDYRLLSTDKREFVMQRTDETQILLKRTAENIIQIGQNLQEVRSVLPHGMYLPWLKSEFGLSQKTANNFVHVAEKFDGKLVKFTNLSVSALYLLAAGDTPQEAVDEAIQKAESGEKVTLALAKKIIEAQEKLKEEQEAKAILQADLFELEAQSVSRETGLTNQIEALKKEMDKLVKPEVQIKEVEKEVTPPLVTAQLATYEEQIKRLNEERAKIVSERDSEKDRAEKFAKRFIDELPERQRKEENERIRAQWHTLATEFQSTVKHLISEWPTILDTRAFDTDEWAEVDIIREAAARVAGECDRFRHKAENVFVDANDSIESYALSVMEQR